MTQTLTQEQQTYSETDAAQFDRMGFLIKRNLFTPEEVAEIRETFMTQAKDGPVAGLSDNWFQATPDDPLAFYPRMMHPHAHPELPVGPLALRYMLDARLQSILTDLYGEEPVAAQSMFYFKPPGARGQDLHQDNYYLRVKPGTCVAAWLAVDDADRENGGMVVVPGTNEMEIVCPEKSDASLFFTSDHVPLPSGLSVEPVDLKAGDVLFFNGSVIHGSYPNTSTNRFRRSLIFHYMPRASQEVSRSYPRIAFDGTPVEIGDAVGGGPCGVGHDMPTSPH